MGKYFGTDGVRGVANLELTPELAFKLGRAGAFILTKENDRPTIIVCKDTRVSGDMLEASLVAGMCSVGASVICVGVAPTPAIPFLIKNYSADAGVVISASHNPFQDNGIKFFNRDGFKLSDELEAEIENLIDNQSDDLPRPTFDKLGSRKDKFDDIKLYIDYLKTTIDTDLSGIKVCVDCANGATYKVAPMLFSELGLDFTPINISPNGFNINENCGSTHLDELLLVVKKNPGSIGIAFDGDGDRCLFIDEDGNFIDGDQIIAICSNFLKQQGLLKNNSIVTTIMSNIGLSVMCKEKGISLSKASVGDRYVLEEMLKVGSFFGGEQSGHIIFLDYNTTGDGILTAIQLLAIIKKSGKKLSELKNVINIFPQVLVNSKVDNKKKSDYMNYPEIKAKIAELEEKFKGQGQVLVRPSGTEPIIRVMIEGESLTEIQSDAEDVARLIEKLLN